MTTTSKNSTRRLLTGAAALVLLAAGQFAGASQAHAVTSIRGSVNCGVLGQFVGMWVETNAGGNGWATYTRDRYNNAMATFSKSVPSTATSVKMTVGCGGTPSQWKGSYPLTVGVAQGSGSKTISIYCGTGWFGAGYCKV